MVVPLRVRILPLAGKEERIKALINKNVFRRKVVQWAKIRRGYNRCGANLGSPKSSVLQHLYVPMSHAEAQSQKEVEQELENKQNREEAKNAAVLKLCVSPKCLQKIIAKILPIFKTNHDYSLDLHERMKYNPANVEIEIIKLLTEKIVLTGKSPHIVSYYDSVRCADITPIFQENPFLRVALRNKEIEPFVNILLAEFISSGSIDDFIKKTASHYSAPKRLKILKAFIWQVLYTLDVAQHMFQFMHNDLHLGNVLIDKVNASVSKRAYFKYTTRGQTFYIPNCGFIPKIWDFDFSQTADIKNSKNYTKHYQSYGIDGIFDSAYDWHFFLQLIATSGETPREIVQFVKSIIPPQLRGADQYTRNQFGMKIFHTHKYRLASHNADLPSLSSLLTHPFFAEYLIPRPDSLVITPTFNSGF